MFELKKYTLAAVAVLGLSMASGAQAATCAVDGATLDTIDSNPFGPVNSTVCEDFAGNIGAGSTFIDGLNDGTFFAGQFAAGTTWSFAGKDENSGDQGGNVEADINNVTGRWEADFTPTVLNNVVVALKGTQNGALFLFKSLAVSGSIFEGTFDMTKAGLIAGGSGGGGGLSNLSVAGVFVSDPPGGVIPVPAGLPLLLSALGLGGLIARRKRKSA